MKRILFTVLFISPLLHAQDDREAVILRVQKWALENRLVDELSETQYINLCYAASKFDRNRKILEEVKESFDAASMVHSYLAVVGRLNKMMEQ